MTAYVDDWSNDGSDSPDLESIAFGIVQWEDAIDSLPYMGGVGNSALGEDAHPAERWAPFLFPSRNSTKVTGAMMLEAWDLLIFNDVPGFRSVDPDEIRVIDSAENFQVYPRAMLLALEHLTVFDVHGARG